MWFECLDVNSFVSMNLSILYISHLGKEHSIVIYTAQKLSLIHEAIDLIV